MKLPNQTELKTTLKELIASFNDIIDIIKKQNEAVVSNNLSRINELAEEQININSELQGKETAFHRELKNSFSTLNFQTDKVSLTLLLTQIDEDEVKDEFTILRDDLVKHVQEAQTAQIRLNELLLFAQEHLNDTLHAIYSFSNQQSVHYDSKGKKAQSQSSMINRTG